MVSPVLAQGATADVSNPVLPFYAIDNKGVLRDLYSLAFQIFDVSDDAKRATPAQVYPVTLGDMQPVNLTADRLGPGRYAADYTAGSSSSGMFEIKWFWQQDSTDATSSVSKPFEILPGTGGYQRGISTYAFVSDLRDEGVLPNGQGGVSDARLQLTLAIAARYVNSITGRSFEPIYAQHLYDGTGGRMLLFQEPVIGVEAAAIDTTPFSQGDLTVQLDLFRVYNRHLRGMVNPDDRNNPKIEFVHTDDLLGVHFRRLSGVSLRSLVWPEGVQNCGVTGLFGYTEPDGSPWGATPELIRRVTMLLALREMVMMTDIDCREDYGRRWRITQEKTRDQMVTLADPRKWGGMTGDPEIDMILTMFSRISNLGNA